ncbi:DUF4191 family protein [Demequina litorisediminis]|uniref:DUF4191 family protein n=1 Tax=Demequina litorisediminis TaxID=1849022 RepID=UPI0024E070CB|nr:DUF4191 family protein [Demequina litorisediminis]
MGGAAASFLLTANVAPGHPRTRLDCAASWRKNPRSARGGTRLVAQAYKSTAPYDKWLLPLLILIPLVIIGAGVAIGLASGSTWILVYAIIFAILAAVLAGMYTLTRRFERNAYIRMEGQPGASISIAQSIRSGWQFNEEPVSVDPRGKGIVFQGVGKGGIVLIAEGGNGARKQVEATTRRLTRLVPGVPVHAIYEGTGEGQVPLKSLVKAIKGHKKALTKAQRSQVAARLNAIGGAKPADAQGCRPHARAPRPQGHARSLISV